MLLLLMGPPGSGKGTQSNFLSERFNFKHISTGEIMRKEVKEKTPIGLKIKDMLERGEYLEDQTVFDLLKDALIKIIASKQSCVLDGYPRTVAQAEMLKEFLDESNTRIDAVILLNIPSEELVKRLCGRFQCSQCGHVYHALYAPPKQEGLCDSCQNTSFEQRADDKQEIVKGRLETYYTQTNPLIEYYNTHNLLRIVDGSPEVALVSKQISKIVCQGETEQL